MGTLFKMMANICEQKKSIGIIMIFLLSAALSHPAEAARKKESTTDAQSYKIGIGDLLQIEVYDEPDLTREVRVLTDGYISFPLLGSVEAQGSTVRHLEKTIRDKLAAKFLVNPQVTVFVKEFSNVFVSGEVKSPGPFPIYGRLTVFEAITLAGGFTEVANPAKVRILRHQKGQELSFEVDMLRFTKKGDASQDMELEANDRVIVPRSFF
jgi:protein involved in polysaccharide export with SLBB domain